MATTRDIDRNLVGTIGDLASAGLPLEQFFQQLTTVLRPALGFDAGCWHGADPVTGLLTSTVAEGLAPDGFEVAAELELWSVDPTRFEGIRRAGRLADTISRSTGGQPERSVRYRELLVHHGWGDELRINLDAHGGRWGAAALMRADDQPPFGERELRLAQRAARVIAGALSRYALPEPAVEPGPITPAVVVIASSGRLAAADPGAQALLAELSEQAELPAGLPTVMTCVAEWARHNAVSSRQQAPSWARLRRPGGEWLAVHASLLDGRADGNVVVVAQPASPTQIIPLTLMALRLSPREQEVALHAVRGKSTREIAAGLFLTPATVQDHLKSVFTKTGVRSRRELVALLLAPQAETVTRPPV
ncbi:helix-turn-helix transcriptional regulator [Streptomyces sp. CAU 1734]|uniref:helix-turn-helix transcriptional regulator n=1 Tax=Streptomyces sp. CAU 1734 TaxID=3140360 RepID=UPI0032613BF0